MAQFTITVPNEFIAALDELVTQTNSGTREQWLRNLVGSTLVNYQVQKELAPQFQQRTGQLSGLWT